MLQESQNNSEELKKKETKNLIYERIQLDLIRNSEFIKWALQITSIMLNFTPASVVISSHNTSESQDTSE